MGSFFVYPSRNLLLMICVWGLCAGCTTTPNDHEGWQNDWFQVSPSRSKIQTVVWGNHSTAVEQTVDWLNNHNHLVVNRWEEEELREGHPPPEGMTDRQTRMLSVAQKVGASLVVFVQVNEKLPEPNLPALNSKNFSRNINVEVRGMNTETVKVDHEAKAWNSGAHASSDQLIRNLTTMALERAFNNPRPPLPIQQAIHQEDRQRVEVIVPSSREREKTSMPTSSEESNKTRTLTHAKNFNSPVPRRNEEKTGEHVPPFLANPDPFIVDDETPNSPTSDLKEDAYSHDPSLGLQTASAALSILYAPFKLAYALLGGIFGGFAYAVTAGDEEVAQTVWNSSLGGTYWLTPEHLRGEKSIHFRGQ